MIVGAIIQARMSSKRFPGKVLKKCNGKPLLLHLISRLKVSKKLNQICVATSDKSSDDIIENLCKTINLPVYRGSLNNVLDRFYNACLKSPKAP